LGYFAFVDKTAGKLNLDIIAILYEHELNKALECQKSGRESAEKKCGGKRICEKKLVQLDER